MSLQDYWQLAPAEQAKIRQTLFGTPHVTPPPPDPAPILPPATPQQRRTKIQQARTLLEHLECENVEQQAPRQILAAIQRLGYRWDGQAWITDDSPESAIRE